MNYSNDCCTENKTNIPLGAEDIPLNVATITQENAKLAAECRNMLEIMCIMVGGGSVPGGKRAEPSCLLDACLLMRDILEDTKNYIEVLRNLIG